MHLLHLEEWRLQHDLGHEHGLAARRRLGGPHKIQNPTAAPADVMSKLRADAASWDGANGFTGDPDSSPAAGRYYGYLAHADGY